MVEVVGKIQYCFWLWFWEVWKMRASGSAYQPVMMGLPALVLGLVENMGDWRAVAVAMKNINSGKYMMNVVW